MIAGKAPGKHRLQGIGAGFIPNVLNTDIIDEIVLVTAHFDTVPGSPGADDNGSGLAGLLECARVLADWESPRTLHLVAFDLEETQSQGRGLFGSRAYAARAHERGEKIVGVFNFEMIGYTDLAENSQRLPEGFELLASDMVADLHARGMRGDFLTVVANQASVVVQQAFAASAKRHAPELPFYSVVAPSDLELSPDLLRSDHYAFWETGFPALMLTDTANFRNPNYHKPTDVPDTLDYSFMASVVKATLGATIELLQENINV